MTTQAEKDALLALVDELRTRIENIEIAVTPDPDPPAPDPDPDPPPTPDPDPDPPKPDPDPPVPDPDPDPPEPDPDPDDDPVLDLPEAHELLPTVGHHKTPDFAQVADKVVAEGQSETLEGEHEIIAVKGNATVTGDLKFTTLMVYPMGSLTIEDGAHLVVKDTPFDYSKDPTMIGNGVIVMGKLRVNGEDKGSWGHVDGQLPAGATVIPLKELPNNWRVGDQLGIPDSRRVSYKVEGDLDVTHDILSGPKPIMRARADRRDQVVTITAINGNIITIDTPLVVKRPGAHNKHGELVCTPYVTNITRNTVLESENPEGVRGHLIMMHRADVKIKGLEIRHMGRTIESMSGRHVQPKKKTGIDNTKFDADGNVTSIGKNQEGRYALHFHHCLGPVNEANEGYQFEVEGCSVHHFLKWGYTIHNTHYGLVKNNVAWDGEEAGFITEQGPETGNRFEYNFAACRMRLGIWFNGARNHLTYNVVGSVVQHGFWFTGSGLDYFPSRRGEEPDLYYTPEGVSTLENHHNESFSTHRKGHLFSSVGKSTHAAFRTEVRDNTPLLQGRNYAHDIKCWHGQRGTIMYLNDSVDYERLEIYEMTDGFTFAGTAETYLKDIIIHGCNNAVILRGRAESSRFMVDGADIFVPEGYRNDHITIKNFSQKMLYGDVIHIFRNVVWNEWKTRTDETTVDLSEKVTSFNQLNQYFVNNEQIFNAKQAPDYVIQDTDKMPAEDVGKTNQQLVDEGRAPWMGEMARSTDRSVTKDGLRTSGFVNDITEAEIIAMWQYISEHSIPSKLDPYIPVN